MLKKFSVVIPSYREEKYIESLLKSIEGQTLQPMEVIVADRYSGDKTREIAKRYGCKIVEGGSAARGRNAGVAASMGKIIIFVDADCRLDRKDFFEFAITRFEEKKADISTTFLDSDGKNVLFLIAREFSNLLKHLNYIFVPIFKGILIEGGCCVVCRRKLFDQISGFDERYKILEDIDFVNRIIRVGGKYYIVPIRVWTSERRYNSKSLLHNLSTIIYVLPIGLMMLFNMRIPENLIKGLDKSRGEMGGE
ncbi:MAG: glycosyltransferase [bacterium]